MLICLAKSVVPHLPGWTRGPLVNFVPQPYCVLRPEADVWNLVVAAPAVAPPTAGYLERPQGQMLGPLVAGDCRGEWRDHG